MYRRKLLLFLLAGLLLCLLRFFSHVNALRHPKVGLVQVDLHKYRVHLNRKIDTECFEQGKRQSHDGARMVSQDASTQNGARLVAQPEISAQAGLKEFCSERWRASTGPRDNVCGNFIHALKREPERFLGRQSCQLLSGGLNSGIEIFSEIHPAVIRRGQIPYRHPVPFTPQPCQDRKLLSHPLVS